MASPDAAILQEIARISGAINRAKAASANTNQTSNSSASIPSSSSSTPSYRGHNPYHQPPPYAQRGAPHTYRGGRGYPPVPYPSNGNYRGASSSSSHTSHHHRGGRGHHQHTITRTHNTWTAPAPAPASATSKDGSTTPAVNGSRHKTLVLNNPASRDKSKSISPSGSTSTPLPVISTDSTSTPNLIGEEIVPVPSTSKTDANEPSCTSTTTPSTLTKQTQEDEEAANKKTQEKQAQQEDVDMEEGEIDESTLPPPEPKKPPISLIKQGNEIIINGVTFVSDASGRKLVRKDSNTAIVNSNNSSKLDTKGKGKMAASSTSSGSTAEGSATSTPSKTSIDGQAYVRTKSGNLISTAVLKKRMEMAEKKKKINEMLAVAKNVQKARQATARAQKKKTLCRYFQKTGVCARANTCPYIHDSSKVSICPRYLRNACPLSSSTCPLSHAPNAHRMPHCQHYPHCKRGEGCPYTHVQVREEAKICKDFVGMGWCERGAECTERHVWECPDFEESGKCTKRGCKLGHVIRRKNANGQSTPVKNKNGAGDEGGMPSFMFLDTNPDPKYVADASIKLPATARKRSASTSIASTEDYSSGEEEAANLVTKKAKTVEVEPPKDAMEANDDYVTLVFSDVEDTADEHDDEEEEDDGSEAESGLEEEHLTSISRKMGPIVYADDDVEGEDTDASDKDETEHEEVDEDDSGDDANTTIKNEPPSKGAPASAAETDSDESDEDL